MKGSVSVEVLIILLVAVYLVLGVGRGFLDKGVYYASDVDRMAMLRASVEKLASAIDVASSGAVGTRITVYVRVPQNGRIEWSGNTVRGVLATLMEYDACGGNACVYEVSVPASFESSGSLGGPDLLVVEKVAPGTVRVST